MFITFGLAVAQRMKDFKEFALNFQKNMNDELENKIEERTKELKIVNHEIEKVLVQPVIFKILFYQILI